MTTGRPTKLTPETHAKIVSYMRAGNYFETACRAAGIAPGTGYRWKAWGAGRPVQGYTTPKTLKPYREFAEACARAEGEAEVEAVLHVRKALSSDPKLSLEYLERRNPQRWGRQVHTVQGDISVGGPVVDALKEYRAVLDELAGESDDDQESAS